MPDSIFELYNISRKDGQPVQDHEFFVLDLTADQNARVHALGYAYSVAQSNPRLAQAIFDKIKQIVTEVNDKSLYWMMQKPLFPGADT